MDPRRFACLLFLSTLPLAAQGLPGLTPTPAPTPVVPKTPEEELAALQREKERLLNEIAYVKERAANATTLLADKFASRGLGTVQVIDAGRSSSAPVVTPPVTPRHARLMQGEELSNFPADVMLVVAGSPISRSTYERLLAHENPNVDPSMRGQMALYDLIRIEGIASAFEIGEHEAQLTEISTQLAAGKTVAELAGQFGSLEGAGEGGRIEIPHNSRFGPRLEQVAFDLEVGETSPPFRHHAGYVVLHKASVEKGATPNLDKVVAHCVQVAYTHAPDALQRAQLAVNSAQLDVVVRDEATMKLLPAVFRAPELQPERTDAMLGRSQMLQKSIDTLVGEIEKARGGGEVEQARLPMLEKRLERLKLELEQTEANGTDEHAVEKREGPGEKKDHDHAEKPQR